jgi:ankyrin repeat protein
VLLIRVYALVIWITAACAGGVAAADPPVIRPGDALSNALMERNFDETVRILDANPGLLRAIRPRGGKEPGGDYTLLHQAAVWGHIGTVAELLRRGLDVNSPTIPRRDDPGGLTPLHIAAERGNVDLMRLLITQGADVNRAAGNGLTPLQAAVKSFDVERRFRLLDPTSPGSRECRWHEAKDVLIEHGAQLDIFVASALGDRTFVANALEANRHLARAHDAEHYTPLHYAASGGDVAIARQLLRADAAVDPKANWWAGSPLHWAIRNDRLEMVKFLVHQGADLEFWSNNGPPLSEAINAKCDEIVEFLIMRGADVNACNADGVRPLQLAVRSRNLTLVALLLRMGADPNGRLGERTRSDFVDRDPAETPFDLATRCGMPEVAELVAKYGGRPGSELTEVRTIRVEPEIASPARQGPSVWLSTIVFTVAGIAVLGAVASMAGGKRRGASP